jgi:hypothetical protein
MHHLERYDQFNLSESSKAAKLLSKTFFGSILANEEMQDLLVRFYLERVSENPKTVQWKIVSREFGTRPAIPVVAFTVFFISSSPYPDTMTPLFIEKERAEEMSERCREFFQDETSRNVKFLKMIDRPTVVKPLPVKSTEKRIELSKIFNFMWKQEGEKGMKELFHDFRGRVNGQKFNF